MFRHDLSMPLEPLLTAYCKWRELELNRASFLWLQFYMRLGLRDTGIAQGLDDGDHIHVFDKQVTSRGPGLSAGRVLLPADLPSGWDLFFWLHTFAGRPPSFLSRCDCFNALVLRPCI